jgi:hypothetical protein
MSAHNVAGCAMTCTWTEDADTGAYDTGCSNKHIFIDGTPAQNGYRFCPYCGGALADAPDPNAHEATRPRWRKMESAPKDGSYILVHFPDGDQMTRLRWVAEREQWRDKSGNIWRVTKAARWIALPPVEDSE